MFSPNPERSFMSRVAETLEGNNTLASGSYALSGLVIDGAIRAISSPDNAVGSFLISYGHDVLFPLQAYFLLRATWINTGYRNKFSWSKSIAVGVAVFAAASGLEFMQKIGLYEGTYDFPGDFIAYGVGVGLSTTLDALTFRKIRGRPSKDLG